MPQSSMMFLPPMVTRMQLLPTSYKSAPVKTCSTAQDSPNHSQPVVFGHRGVGRCYMGKGDGRAVQVPWGKRQRQDLEDRRGKIGTGKQCRRQVRCKNHRRERQRRKMRESSREELKEEERKEERRDSKVERRAQSEHERDEKHKQEVKYKAKRGEERHLPCP